MHALENIHAALRPRGLLLDVRPAPGHPWIAVHQRGNTGCESERVVRLGQMDDSYRIGTLATADAALHTLVDAGRFVAERAQVFTFVYHFDSVDAWLAYMAEQWTSARISPELIARAEQELSGRTGEVRVLRTMRASRCRRM